jgi:hypothetical protein
MTNRDQTVKQWLWNQADFEFGKVCFDGRKLSIANRRALIKRVSSFPNVYTDKDFNLCWDRKEKAEYKGFTVTLTPDQWRWKDDIVKREHEAKEKQKQKWREIRAREKAGLFGDEKD